MQAETTNRRTFWPVIIRSPSPRPVSDHSRPLPKCRLTPRLAWTRNWDFINPSIDSLQEFKVTTSNYDASFGSVAGALLQATTKSGTNGFHGSLFEYLRNDAFNAANWAAQQDLPLRWNQFGGSFGGPILKNKLFFFADYQGLRRRRSESTITTVPTQAERNGDLRALLGDYICAGGRSEEHTSE